MQKYIGQGNGSANSAVVLCRAMVGNFIRVTPFMHVPDIEKAVAFFRDLLGFKVWLHFRDYAYVQRETAGFRLLQNKGSDGAPPGNRRFAYYIDVNDVDALLAELQPKLDRLAKGELFGPVDQEYGQRELMIVAPDGNLLVFGQEIPRT
jgi:catechol 2,3-dioxygenase-like lactoylglutathione lyase family enzyme